ARRRDRRRGARRALGMRRRALRSPGPPGSARRARPPPRFRPPRARRARRAPRRAGGTRTCRRRAARASARAARRGARRGEGARAPRRSGSAAAAGVPDVSESRATCELWRLCRTERRSWTVAGRSAREGTTDARRDLGAEELDRPQDEVVRQRADAHLREEPLVAEDLVL